MIGFWGKTPCATLSYRGAHFFFKVQNNESTGILTGNDSSINMNEQVPRQPARLLNRGYSGVQIANQSGACDFLPVLRVSEVSLEWKEEHQI